MATPSRSPVRDTGRGVAAEHLPYVFKRFYRIDPAQTCTTGDACKTFTFSLPQAVSANGSADNA